MPTLVASGRTGFRAKAAVPLRRGTPHRPMRTFRSSSRLAEPRPDHKQACATGIGSGAVARDRKPATTPCLQTELFILTLLRNDGARGTAQAEAHESACFACDRQRRRDCVMLGGGQFSEPRSDRKSRAAGWAIMAARVLWTGALSVLAMKALAADWPCSGRDVHNTRNAEDEHVLDSSRIAELKPLWTLTTDGNVAATPAVVDGMVYAPDFGGSLWAVDAATTCALSRAGQNRRSEGEGFAVIRRTESRAPFRNDRYLRFAAVPTTPCASLLVRYHPAKERLVS